MAEKRCVVRELAETLCEVANGVPVYRQLPGDGRAKWDMAAERVAVVLRARDVLLLDIAQANADEIGVPPAELPEGV